jgi:hypothetical protein
MKKLIAMSFILSYISLTYSQFGSSKSRFGGSSKFRVDGDTLYEISSKKQEKPNPIFSQKIESENIERILKPFGEECGWDENFTAKETDQVSEINDITISKPNQIEEPRTYKLNKSKVKKKCHAFSRLAKSKKFLAFYTISFPNGLPDDTCYKVFNTWLTRCRKNAALESYLWVAERQKNSTIHFHLLTNDYMEIIKVNGFMAAALATEKRKGADALKGVDLDIYNGVDVKRVKGNSKSLIGYLAKYVSKNDIEFYRLPWHCSRDISRLFVTEHFEDDEVDRVTDQLPQDEHKYQIFKTEYYNTASFKFTPEEKVYSDIDSINEIVYKSNN